jgi:hypothetical protein
MHEGYLGPGVHPGDTVTVTSGKYSGTTFTVSGIFGCESTGVWGWHSKAEDPVYKKQDIPSEAVTKTGTIAVEKECHGLVDGRWAAKGECYLRKDEEDLVECQRECKEYGAGEYILELNRMAIDLDNLPTDLKFEKIGNTRIYTEKPISTAPSE